jgi:hypothetical protein
MQVSAQGTVKPDGTLELDNPLPLPGGRVLVNVQPLVELAPTPEDQKRFRELVKRWKKGVGHLSSAARMAKHPAYQEIIQMGVTVVPLLLTELKRDPDFWFAALREITGENPVPEESAGKVKEMTRVWIEWGRQRGYIQ